MPDKAFPWLVPGKTNPETSDRASASLRIAMALVDKGMVWIRFAFIRAAGTLHTENGELGLMSKLISSQQALRISPEREAVRIRNSSASFVASLALELLMASMHLATSE